MTPAIRLENVCAAYGGAWPQRSNGRLALDRIELTVPSGCIFGVVGESGSGKSTLARVVLRLMQPTCGSVAVAGQDPYRLKGRTIAQFRRLIQPVFQDSMAALDPRIRVGDSLRMVLDLHAIGRPGDRQRVVENLLTSVGLASLRSAISGPRPSLPPSCLWIAAICSRKIASRCRSSSDALV